jgi:Leucine-rich repeat (LRR) protein
MLLKFFALLAVTATLASAQRTTCTFQTVFLSYTCRLENQVIRNDNDMEEIGGVHNHDRVNNHVRRVDHEGSIVLVFPSLMVDHFTGLTTLILSGVQMRTMSRFIVNCRELTTVEVNRNEIEAIPSGIFRNCARMSTLRIADNRISTVHEDAFMGLGNLGTLTLTNNSITSFTRQHLRHTTRIQTISLGRNEIEEITADTFADLTNLRTLNLNNNRLSSWSREILSQHPLIESLNLANNQFQTLAVDVFSNLPNLASLTIGGLTEFPILEGVQRLTRFSVSGSPTTRIPSAWFANMNNLNTLVLMGNRLESVDFSMTEPKILGNLRHLDLFSNQISNLSASSFEMLTGLRILTLTFNELLHLPFEPLKPVLPLEILDIGFNRITRIDREILEKSPGMRVSASSNRCFSGNFIVNDELDWTQLDSCFNSGVSMKVSSLVLVLVGFVAFSKKILM